MTTTSGIHSDAGSAAAARLRAGVLAGLLAAALLPGCASNPATGDIDIVLMSESAEINMGREMHEQLLADNTMIYGDDALQAYVNRIGQDLAKNSARPDIEYTFTVIDDENINAFALPGGYIYINRGLMTYLDNEAELASVLAHEIGHVTARHAIRQHSAQAANRTMATLAYILTGSGSLANTSAQYGAAMVRGYGREHELEADGEGAKYLYNAGYDPNAALEMIGVLKDHEQYMRARAKRDGKRIRSYHGLYSTHPRNDRRLQEVIRAASGLEPRPAAATNAAEFRRMTEGLLYGKRGITAQGQESRYYHNQLRFTFAYPGGWTVNTGSRTIVVQNADGSSKVTLTIARKTDPAQDDRVFLGQKLNAARLFQSAPLHQAGIHGHTGISPASGERSSRRLAMLKRGNLAYLFEGEVADEGDFQAQDGHFMQIVESFRPMKRSEHGDNRQLRMHWVQADGKTTYAQLARLARIPDAENQLRLMNGHYPRGEPAAGDWIKIIRQ